MTTKDYKKAESNTHLKKLCDVGLTRKKIAEAFGVSLSSIQGWLRASRPCPYWTKIASDGILRRMGGLKQSTLLIRCPREQEETISKVATGLGAIVTVIKI
ncbi:hypothetical protein LCGC14_3111920 [marine sediment metagenome]|uniref:Uncharacterized protein n=1 Tax=marine sediment metagenome TaxID=412755 RepID=A0A0F8W4U5_9ZZZZ